MNNRYAPQTPGVEEQPPVNELEAWEKKLLDLGLSMDQGSSPSWITYGWDYRDADIPFDYSTKNKRPDQNEQRNEDLALKLLALMNAGASMSAAARQLGVAPSNASVTLKRYRERTK